MIQIVNTNVYEKWFRSLRDHATRARINTRIRRLSLGNPGDVKPVGEGVSELRVDVGPGYRIYFVQWGLSLVVLLAAGEKATQKSDIREAKLIARRLKEGFDVEVNG